jgi:hypothetical protein
LYKITVSLSLSSFSKRRVVKKRKVIEKRRKAER